MNNSELKAMIELVKYNNTLESRLAGYEAEYRYGKSLIDSALDKVKPKKPGRKRVSSHKPSAA